MASLTAGTPGPGGTDDVALLDEIDNKLLTPSDVAPASDPILLAVEDLTGEPADRAPLGIVVDEVVLQIYQGRRVIPGYAGYLAALDRLQVPSRIGLL